MNLVDEALDLLDELESQPSKNGKLAILERGKDNAVLKGLLELAYNPFKMYNIVAFGDVSPQKDKEPTLHDYARLVSHLNLLTTRTLTGGEAVATINTFFHTLGEREFKWYSRVLKKDLRSGITSSTINKAYPKLVPVFDCMLAKPWKDIKKKPKEVIVDSKLDGYRNVAFVNEDGSVELFTRNGKPILGFRAVEEELKKLPRGMVYDGELVGKVRYFKEMQKLVFNKKLTDKEANFVIFDLLPIKEFEDGKSTKTLYRRKLDLVKLQEHNSKLEHLKFEIGSQILDPVADWNLINEMYEEVLSDGLEGIMIKDANAVYTTKRSFAWSKLKPFELADLEIIGSVEGEGKNVGKLGSVVVDWKGYEVEVGSGFSDLEREDLWARRNEIVGKVIEVQYASETSNDKGTISLLFPTFKGFREDKEGTITS